MVGNKRPDFDYLWIGTLNTFAGLLVIGTGDTINMFFGIASFACAFLNLVFFIKSCQ